jgi:hypothetical protein
MNRQHVNVKIYAEGGSAPSLSDFIPVFHSWIRDDVLEELLIDVADYSHVPAGPGIMLIGDRANYSVEYGVEERFGLSYNHKNVDKSGYSAAIAFALRRAAGAALHLMADDRLQGRLHFPGRQLKVGLIAPDGDKRLQSIQPCLQPVLDACYGKSRYQMEKTSLDPREPLTLQISCDHEDEYLEAFLNSTPRFDLISENQSVNA